MNHQTKAARPIATGTIGTPSQRSRSVTASGKNQLIRFPLFVLSKDKSFLHSCFEASHEQTSGRVRTRRRRQAPGGRAAQQNEYNPTTAPSSPARRGSCPLRSPGIRSRTPRPWHLRPTRPHYAENRRRRKSELARRFFSPSPSGWTRRWNRESPYAPSVVSCIGGRGGSRGAGESVWLNEETKRQGHPRISPLGLPEKNAVWDAGRSNLGQKRSRLDGLSLRMRHVSSWSAPRCSEMASKVKHATPTPRLVQDLSGLTVTVF